VRFARSGTRTHGTQTVPWLPATRFTTVSVSPAAVGGYVSQSSGGITSNSVDPLPPAGKTPVRVVGGSVGANTTGTPTVMVSVTNYSKPIPLGSYWTLLNPIDLLGFLERQVCK